MKKGLAFLLCLLICASVFSAWIFVPKNQIAIEQEMYKQIAVEAIKQKYGIDISDTIPTYAVKDDHGNITTWRNLVGDVSVYVYGQVVIENVPHNYFVFYSVALDKMLACNME